MGRRSNGFRRLRWAALIVAALISAVSGALAPAAAQAAEDCACGDPVCSGCDNAVCAKAVGEILADNSCSSGACGLLTCNSCGAGGVPGVGGFCGNLVTPLGGCSSGFELFWVRADYMAWKRDGVSLPALATSSPVGTPLANQAKLGFNTTTVLAGQETVSDGWRSGFRIEGGFWFNPATGSGLSLDYFNGGRDSYGFEYGPNDGRIIGRPFFNAQTDLQDARIIDAPGELSGVVAGSVFDDFQGAGATYRQCIWNRGNACSSTGGAQLSALGGYRYYHQDSLVYLRENYTVVNGAAFNPPLTNGLQAFGAEKFAGRNEFNGAEIGLQGRIQRCRWWCEGLAAVAIGATERVMFVEGSTLILEPGFAPSVEGGVLLTSAVTNFGRYTDDEFQAIPRFRIGAGWQVNEWLGLRAGYNLVIWNIVQAADHLPPGLAVDPRNLPTIAPGGGPEPIFPGIRETTMVAHGLDLGLEMSF